MKKNIFGLVLIVIVLMILSCVAISYKTMLFPVNDSERIKLVVDDLKKIFEIKYFRINENYIIVRSENDLKKINRFLSISKYRDNFTYTLYISNNNKIKIYYISSEPEEDFGDLKWFVKQDLSEVIQKYPESTCTEKDIKKYSVLSRQELAQYFDDRNYLRQEKGDLNLDTAFIVTLLVNGYYVYRSSYDGRLMIDIFQKALN